MNRDSGQRLAENAELDIMHLLRYQVPVRVYRGAVRREEVRGLAAREPRHLSFQVPPALRNGSSDFRRRLSWGKHMGLVYQIGVPFPSKSFFKAFKRHQKSAL